MKINIEFLETDDAQKCAAILQGLASAFLEEVSEDVETVKETKPKKEKKEKEFPKPEITPVTQNPGTSSTELKTTDEAQKAGLTGDYEKDKVIIRELATQKSIAGFREALKKMLSEYGVGKLTDAPQEKQLAIYTDLQNLKPAA